MAPRTAEPSRRHQWGAATEGGAGAGGSTPASRASAAFPLHVLASALPISGRLGCGPTTLASHDMAVAGGQAVLSGEEQKSCTTGGTWSYRADTTGRASTPVAAGPVMCGDRAERTLRADRGCACRWSPRSRHAATAWGPVPGRSTSRRRAGTRSPLRQSPCWDVWGGEQSAASAPASGPESDAAPEGPAAAAAVGDAAREGGEEHVACPKAALCVVCHSVLDASDTRRVKSQ